MAEKTMFYGPFGNFHKLEKENVKDILRMSL
jgi:hypothetical protein